MGTGRVARVLVAGLATIAIGACSHPDGSGSKAVTSSADGLGSSGPVWSPDGIRLLFVRNPDGGQFHSELWIAGVDGSGLSQISDRPAEYFSYGWSPVIRRS